MCGLYILICSLVFVRFLHNTFFIKINVLSLNLFNILVNQMKAISQLTLNFSMSSQSAHKIIIRKLRKRGLSIFFCLEQINLVADRCM